MLKAEKVVTIASKPEIRKVDSQGSDTGKTDEDETKPPTAAKA
jgi:hypothetical protein